jgi:hypothetical protein
MSIPSLCIYSNQNPYVLLYNARVEKKYMDDIEKVINSPKWKETDTTIIRIEYDANTQFCFRTTDNYIYIMISNNLHSLKIYELIDKIYNFVESQSITNFNSYTKNFDSMIKTFVEQENRIGKIQGQIRDVTATMTDTIAITIDRGNNIENLQQKTNNLKDSAIQFDSSARVLKRNAQWRNIKMTLIISFVVILVITIIILIATQ